LAIVLEKINFSPFTKTIFLLNQVASMITDAQNPAKTTAITEIKITTLLSTLPLLFLQENNIYTKIIVSMAILT